MNNDRKNDQKSTIKLSLTLFHLFISISICTPEAMKYIFAVILITSFIVEAFTEEAFEQKEDGQDSSKTNASGLCN